MCENNNNYSEIAEAYRNYRNSFYNDFNNSSPFINNDCECDRDRSRDRDCDFDRDRDRDRDRNRDRNLCCGRKFDNSPMDRRTERALRNFENQLRNTNNSINCLNQCFNNLEDTLFDNRCCLSNRIKNILRSIQRDICDLQDNVRSIADDTTCLNQSL